MLTPKQMIYLVDEGKINYSLCKGDKTIRNLSDEDRDINVIIGIRGREFFLKPCISYFKRAIDNCPNKKIKLILVEQDVTPKYEQIAKELGVEYIFAHNDIVFRGENYSRAYVYNIGFLLAKPSKWYILHDIDILIDENYFKHLDTYLLDSTKWVQPYQKKRVIVLSERATNFILDSGDTFVDLSKVEPKEPAMPGSTGGSLAVRRDMFIEAGGLDPEYFFGYGPEDSFFWSKLEVLDNPNLNKMPKGHFAGGGVFANDPAIDVYHMYHVPMWYSNPHEYFMLDIRMSFWGFSHDEKIAVIDKKRNILLEAIDILK